MSASQPTTSNPTRFRPHLVEYLQTRHSGARTWPGGLSGGGNAPTIRHVTSTYRPDQPHIPPSRDEANFDAVVVATDGSCLGNPGPGGWAWYVADDCWAAGGQAATTNNQMEILAVAEALRAIPAHMAVIVEADSQYVISGLTDWIHGWRARGWRTAAGKPVANRQLWEEVAKLMEGRDVTFRHVRGHRGHELNEAADSRARAAATAIQEGNPINHGPGWTHGGEVEPEPGHLF